MNKKILISVAAVLMVVGCSSNKKASEKQTTSPVDLPPAPMAVAPAPEPVAVSRAVSYDNPKSASSSISGSKYVVQKGDTLWSIAAKKYGDGKQYKKIQSANNLKGDSILVGQSLTLP